MVVPEPCKRAPAERRAVTPASPRRRQARWLWDYADGDLLRKERYSPQGSDHCRGICRRRSMPASRDFALPA